MALLTTLRRAAVLAVGALLWAPTGAAEPQPLPADSLLKYQLQDLQSPATRNDLSEHRGRPTLLVIFEPHCPWCRRQAKAFGALDSDCKQQFQPLAIGINGNRQQLKQAARQLRIPFPSYRASAAMLAALGTVPATPLSILTDADGRYLDHRRGYQNPEKLRQWLRDQDLPCS